MQFARCICKGEGHSEFSLSFRGHWSIAEGVGVSEWAWGLNCPGQTTKKRHIAPQDVVHKLFVLESKKMASIDWKKTNIKSASIPHQCSTHHQDDMTFFRREILKVMGGSIQLIARNWRCLRTPKVKVTHSSSTWSIVMIAGYRVPLHLLVPWCTIESSTCWYESFQKDLQYRMHF